jgi:hypothetical protein
MCWAQILPDLPFLIGDPASMVLHRSLADLEAGFRVLPEPPKDLGRVALIVCRRAPGVHEPLDRVRITLEEGVPDDEWNRRPGRDPASQITVIRRDVSELIANGQPLTESGDNLVVDLEISTPNLPAGSRLRVGDAIVEVTPKPHNGCAKFLRRFGADALQFVQAPATRHHNLRGVHWRVIEPGEVRVGAEIRVLSRP